MGITPKDIAAQRAMLERGEQIVEAKRQQAERERLRDTFAAAALTGLLSLNRPGLNQKFPTELCERAFEWAGAMLREQDKQSVGVAEVDSASVRKSVATPRACASSCSQPFDSAPTTHDAAPEAKATNDGGTPKDAGGTGNTQEPVAWMVQNADGERWLCHNHPAAAKYGLRCVPLFAKPQPMLTDEERKAILVASRSLVVASSRWRGSDDDLSRLLDKANDALGSLLERLK